MKPAQKRTELSSAPYTTPNCSYVLSNIQIGMRIFLFFQLIPVLKHDRSKFNWIWKQSMKFKISWNKCEQSGYKRLLDWVQPLICGETFSRFVYHLHLDLNLSCYYLKLSNFEFVVENQEKS